MTITQAKRISGGLGNSSKMPGRTYGLSASQCRVGQRLAKLKNTTCSGCYALQGNYLYPNVQKAHENRFNSWYHPKWVESMVLLLQDESYFRWHDSGDIQNYYHLCKIVKVCELTPWVKHWLPTQERAIVRRYTKPLPDNLVIRFSSPKINQLPSLFDANSLVVTPEFKPLLPTTVKPCPAPDQNNECGECRACWSKEVKTVAYTKHGYDLITIS